MSRFQIQNLVTLDNLTTRLKDFQIFSICGLGNKLGHDYSTNKSREVGPKFTHMTAFKKFIE